MRPLRFIVIAKAIGLLVLLLAGTSLPAQNASFFPRPSTVVFLAGLPGDVESENSYRGQLQTWLEVATQAEPEKLFVLWDDPNLLGLTPPAQAQLLRASQQEFLKLGKRLAGQTNPVVVIAWGHGGMQGRHPVFHVRGPRLTPEDFGFFARQMPDADCRWVLAFRGSGQFAATLAGPRRTIVATDAKTSASSDPIGLPLALQKLRARPSLSFQEFTAELGRATAAWYDQRGLARTEEPTLWLNSEPPRPLAVSTDAETLAAAPQTPPEPEHQKNPTEAPETPLPPVWKEIQRVEAKQYPGLDAVILRQVKRYTLRGSPAVELEHEEFIQVLTPEGKAFGDFDLAFSPQQENVTFQDCEVLRPSGRLVRLEPDEILETGEESLGDYRNARRLFFALPGIEPGAVIHFRYHRVQNKFSLPHLWLEVPLAGKAPALEARVEVTLAKNLAFHFGFRKFPPADPTVSQSTYGSTYTWRLQELPAETEEILAPPDHAPALLLSTFPDWAALAGWYARIIQLTDEVTPEISAKAAELTRHASSDRDKILALYHYVTGLRYVAVPIGINAVRPHAAAKVLKNQFGDCKDKATLLNTLARSLNIPAQLALVPRFRQAEERLPGFSFNHAISRIQLGSECLWIDTTDDVCRFGMLPPGDPGRNVLVIDGTTTNLTRLPDTLPGEHALRIQTTVEEPDPTGHLPVVFQAQASGFPDYELRTTARMLKAKNSAQPLFTVPYALPAGAFVHERQELTPVSALEERFTWNARGYFLGGLSRDGDRVLLRAPFWLPRTWQAAMQPRRQPLLPHQGYPFQLEQTCEFKLPAAARRVTLPARAENDRPPVRWSLAWENPSPARLVARLRVDVTQGEITRAELTAAQAQWRELYATLASVAGYSLPQP